MAGTLSASIILLSIHTLPFASTLNGFPLLLQTRLLTGMGSQIRVDQDRHEPHRQRARTTRQYVIQVPYRDHVTLFSIHALPLDQRTLEIPTFAPSYTPLTYHPAGQSSDDPTSLPANTNKTSTTHVTNAEKIRFGQALSEQGGVSGHTAPDHTSGSAKQAGGFGGTESLLKDIEGGGDAVQGIEGEGVQSRRAQGYGGKNDMQRDVGA